MRGSERGSVCAYLRPTGGYFLSVFGTRLSLAREGRESKNSLFYEIYALFLFRLKNLLIHMHAVTMSRAQFSQILGKFFTIFSQTFREFFPTFSRIIREFFTSFSRIFPPSLTRGKRL